MAVLFVTELYKPENELCNNASSDISAQQNWKTDTLFIVYYTTSTPSMQFRGWIYLKLCD